MSIFLHHKVTKNPSFQCYCTSSFFTTSSLTFCPVRRLHNFNNDINLVLLWTSNVRLTVPCCLAVRFWGSHRHGPGSIPGMGKIPLCAAFFSSSNNKRKTISLVYMSSNFVKYRAKVFVSSRAGNILTIFLI